MAIERVRRVGPYAPLSATYFMDDAVAEAGEAAELLFLRGLAFSASRPEAEGYISEVQLRRFVGVGMVDADDRAQRLVDVGLWERVGGGYVVRSWLRWNKSADELNRYRARDRDRKSRKPDTDPAADDAGRVGADVHSDSDNPSARNPRGVRSDSDSASDTHSTTQHFTHSTTPPSSESMESHASGLEVEDQASEAASRGATVKPGSDNDPNWIRLWDVYPRKDGKKAARAAYAKAVKKTDPEVIIAGAERYRDRMARERAPREKIKMAQGWLNDERWEDEAEQPLLQVVGGSDFDRRGGNWWEG